jgi:hypothetical protein
MAKAGAGAKRAAWRAKAAGLDLGGGGLDLPPPAGRALIKEGEFPPPPRKA